VCPLLQRTQRSLVAPAAYVFIVLLSVMIVVWGQSYSCYFGEWYREAVNEIQQCEAIMFTAMSTLDVLLHWVFQVTGNIVLYLQGLY